MVRWPFVLCAAVLAGAAIIGVRELLWDGVPETLIGAGAMPAPDDARGPSRELASPDATEVTLKAPLAIVADVPWELSNPGSGERKAVLFDTVTLFDRGLHAEDVALSERWQVGLGLTSAGNAFGNDRASSVEIPAGLQATLFDDPEGQGFKLTLGPGTHDLAALAFSERASSIRVSRYGELADTGGPEDAVVLYEHRGADLLGRGEAWRLELPRGRDEWTFRASRGAFADDRVSTAWVPQGHELVLFAELDASGIALVLGPGLPRHECGAFADLRRSG